MGVIRPDGDGQANPIAKGMATTTPIFFYFLNCMGNLVFSIIFVRENGNG
jgi:hypothetical protein